MLSAAFALLLSYPLLLLRTDRLAGSFPRPLSAKEEEKYIELCANGDTAAKNILIEHNLRLVAHIIKKYYTQTGDQDDLISIGTIGLIKGVSSYKPDRGVRLATYASRCIENEILMHFRSMKRTGTELSLSEAIDTDKEGNALSLMDVIFVEDDMLENLSSRETCMRLHQYMNASLSVRERSILAMRYGIGGGTPMTQREVAEACNISRSYVSRIEKKAIETLKRRFDEEDI